MEQQRTNILSPNFQHDEILAKANIAEKFSNLKESLLPDNMYAFQEEVKKGNVDILTKDDLEKSFGGSVMYKPNYVKLGEDLDRLIEKGETSFMTEEEFDFVEKATPVYRNMIRKALPIHKDGTDEVLAHVEVFVAPTIIDGTDEE
mgnify:CR=1 FL=1